MDQDQEEKDGSVLAEIAARAMGGVLLHIEGHDVIVYRCNNCGEECRARMVLCISPMEHGKKPVLNEEAETRMTEIPGIIRKAFEEGE